MAAFKTDESFLEKISLGAIGTQQVFHKLVTLGHKPIELERGSMNYKIWKKIKIKRIRVPDIICVDNGIRIESRAKSKLEITMSHSLNDPTRGWDADLKNEDYVALIACKKGDLSPVDWIPNSPIQFVSVKELRDSFQRKEVITEKAKGVQEGSEVRVTWLSCIAGKEMTVTEVTKDKIEAKPKIGKKSTWRLNRKKGGISILLKSQVKKVLESVIVLNEIKSARACKLLCKILLDENFDAEIRAGAAWGLGEQQNKDALTAIVSSFNAVEESIRIEAARALAKLTKNYSNDILKKFTNATSNEKPGVAWALTKSNSLMLDQLLTSIKDQDSKEWISYIIGTHGEEKYISEIEKIKTKDPEVYFAVTLLWKIMTSWIYELKEY
ncbi:MAG: HEAT repeat domain-containing protein [Chitinophagaceae bacterium]|nr:HEAT repeat domain-containing protein [Chitinophagaceae bacterium]